MRQLQGLAECLEANQGLALATLQVTCPGYFLRPSRMPGPHDWGMALAHLHQNCQEKATLSDDVWRLERRLLGTAAEESSRTAAAAAAAAAVADVAEYGSPVSEQKIPGHLPAADDLLALTYACPNLQCHASCQNILCRCCRTCNMSAH